MRSYNLRIPAYPGQGTPKHFVGDRMREHNQKIRRPNPVFHVRTGLAENLGFTSVFPTDIRVLPLHTFISTENHYAHCAPPIVSTCQHNS